MILLNKNFLLSFYVTLIYLRELDKNIDKLKYLVSLTSFFDQFTSF